jgi:hypothetical protein
MRKTIILLSILLFQDVIAIAQDSTPFFTPYWKGNVLTTKDYDSIYNKVYADRAIRCTGTPYFGMYILQALTKMGKEDKALEMIRDYWGTMIQAGATTTWEEWHPTWQLPIGALYSQFDPPVAYCGGRKSIFHG